MLLALGGCDLLRSSLSCKVSVFFFFLFFKLADLFENQFYLLYRGCDSIKQMYQIVAQQNTGRPMSWLGVISHCSFHFTAGRYFGNN